MTQADFATALASGCWRMLGCTPAGLPVVLVKLGLWDPSKYDPPWIALYLSLIHI